MDRDKLNQYLTVNTSNQISEIHLHSELDSTNAEALRLIESGKTGIHLVISDAQSAGKGRRGRTWLSPAGSGLYLSLVYPFSESADKLQALSLVTALSVHHVLLGFGAKGLMLKWPNDILLGDKKISGILLELKRANARSFVVFGIGVNYDFSDQQKLSVDRPVVDLMGILQTKPELELVAAIITGKLLQNILEFLCAGFSNFQLPWNQYDRYISSEIVVQRGGKKLIGQSKGVDETGALVIQSTNGIKRISGGEVLPSLREASEGILS